VFEDSIYKIERDLTNDEEDSNHTAPSAESR
jgi:hypothetical protein